MIGQLIDYLHSFLFTFHSQLAVCALLFCYHLPRRGKFPLRLLPFLPFCLLPMLVRQITGNVFYQLPYFMLGWYPYSFAAAFVITTLLCWLCFRAAYLQILFFCSAGYILQNMLYMVRSIVEKLAPAGQGTALWMAGECAVLALALFAADRLLVSRLKNKQVDIENRPLLAVTLLVLFIINVMNYWTYSFGYENLATMAYELICCVLLFIVHFGLLNRSLMLREQAVMAERYSAAERQQRMSQEIVELINRKCHDLRHQISLIRRITNAEEAEKTLREVEGAIHIYDSMAKTGNEALDAILSEKSLLCEQYKINFSFIAAGDKLKFMDLSDLYSLFGNALDNMIESVSQEAEENRIASLVIAPKGELLSVVLDNYCGRRLSFRDGLPQTTKENDGYHGFGTRSIRYIVKKYGGTVTMRQDVETHHFILSILFPMTRGEGLSGPASN